ncbi:hypothetical protein [Leuconostoc citreum]|uniref:hypothetical protein n=1 Tax=Leuconostoc citreum TaxID=33964 RepID=UPI0015F65AAC|nr:hypothetical protein [Leuconostoc citreum]MBA5939078.1 hypothetical protein [Leuconostoc citreum]
MNKLVIPKISEKSNFWMVRAGQAGKYYNDFRINGYVGVDTFGIEKQEIPENSKPDIKKIQETYRDSILEKLKKGLSEKELSRRGNGLRISAGRKAATLVTFRHEMKNGDFIITPAPRSQKYLLGFLTKSSDFSISHKRTDEEYHHSPFSEGKEVVWLKIIDFYDIPSDLKYVRHGNGSIFNISQFKDQLLPLYFSKYIYQDTLTVRLDVASKATHTSSEIYALQTVFEESKTDTSVDYIQKTKIASSGFVILTTVVYNADSILNILHALGIGTAITGVPIYVLKNLDKITNFVTTIRDWKRDQAKEDLEIEQLKLNNQATKLDNQKKREALSKTNSSSEISAENVREKLEISDKTVGNPIVPDISVFDSEGE